MKCVQAMISEIFQFRELIETQSKEIDYLRQKENKLMYLFFTLHKSGVDVNEVYERKLKDVPTERFNEWVKDHIDDDEPPEISFESDASFSPIHKGPMPQPKRPKFVPQLKLNTIPDYITSSDEEGEQEQEQEQESVIIHNKQSLDGSKLHRRSEIESDMSFTQNNENEPLHKRFVEDYPSQIGAYKGNKLAGDAEKSYVMSSLDNLGQILPVSQSLITDSLNFNL